MTIATIVKRANEVGPDRIVGHAQNGVVIHGVVIVVAAEVVIIVARDVTDPTSVKEIDVNANDTQDDHRPVAATMTAKMTELITFVDLHRIVTNTKPIIMHEIIHGRHRFDHHLHITDIMHRVHHFIRHIIIRMNAKWHIAGYMTTDRPKLSKKKTRNC